MAMNTIAVTYSQWRVQRVCVLWLSRVHEILPESFSQMSDVQVLLFVIRVRLSCEVHTVCLPSDSSPHPALRCRCLATLLALVSPVAS